MSWTYLLIAGLFEIAWAVSIKYCEDLKPNIFLFIVIISMGLSVYFLSLATKDIPIGIAYAVWTGIGIVGTFLFSLLILKEPIEMISAFFILMILTGIIGLKMFVKA